MCRLSLAVSTLLGCCSALAEDPVEFRDLDLKRVVEDTLYIMDPARPIGDESLSNGSLVKLGVYGGMAQDSKSYPRKPDP